MKRSDLKYLYVGDLVYLKPELQKVLKIIKIYNNGNNVFVRDIDTDKTYIVGLGDIELDEEIIDDRKNDYKEVIKESIDEDILEYVKNALKNKQDENEDYSIAQYVLNNLEKDIEDNVEYWAKNKVDISKIKKDYEGCVVLFDKYGTCPDKQLIMKKITNKINELYSEYKKNFDSKLEKLEKGNNMNRIVESMNRGLRRKLNESSDLSDKGWATTLYLAKELKTKYGVNVTTDDDFSTIDVNGMKYSVEVEMIPNYMLIRGNDILFEGEDESDFIDATAYRLANNRI